LDQTARLQDENGGKLHKDKIHNLYSSLCITRVIKARVGGAGRPNTHGDDKQMCTFV